MIYITGDTHGFYDCERIITFNNKYKLTKDDYVIICGDAGVCWEKQIDKEIQRFYGKLECTILFVDGNHENFVTLNSYPVEMWNGGKIHRISNNIIHLMRGQVFTIDGHTFFTMGGAESHDKPGRVEGISWWPQEMPNDDEYQEGLDNLEKYNNQVDYILTHDCPDSILDIIGNHRYKHDKLTNYLQVIKDTVSYKTWFFGHHHIYREFDKEYCLYNDFMTLDGDYIHYQDIIESHGYEIVDICDLLGF